MIKQKAKSIGRLKRHRRIRKHISGTPTRPRLVVFRSNTHIYAQIIDDTKGLTLCASSTMEPAVKAKVEKTWNTGAAAIVGTDVAQKALAIGIESVVFDRGGYIYHGKVKALGDAAREAGLKF